MIEADIGLGKSQLLYNVFQHNPLRVFTTAASPFETAPYSVWKSIITQVIDAEVEMQPEVYTSSSAANRRQCISTRLTAGTSSITPTTLHAPSTESTLSLSPVLNEVFGDKMFVETDDSLALDKSARLSKAASLLLTLLRSFTATNPVALCIDDAVLMDTDSWALMLRATQHVDGLLVIMATRPVNRSFMTAFARDVPAEYAALLASPTTTHVVIHARTDEEIYSIACDCLGEGVMQLPAPLAHLLLTKSAGNPRVVKELIASLLLDGVISVSDETQIVTVTPSLDLTLPADHTHVPIPLQCILGCRLDRLSHVQRMILKVAAMIGDEFDVDLTFRAYPLTIEDQQQWYDELASLVRLNILCPCDSTAGAATSSMGPPSSLVDLDPSNLRLAALIAPQQCYTFTNGFMRDMVLSRLPRVPEEKPC